MDVRLTEPDRRSVDFLLSGDAPSDDAGMSPLARGAFLDRVNSARRILSLLETMPVEEPPANLAEATLRKIAASQVANAQNPPSASANL